MNKLPNEETNRTATGVWRKTVSLVVRSGYYELVDLDLRKYGRCFALNRYLWRNGKILNAQS